MSTTKRWISLLLVLCLIASYLPAVTFAITPELELNNETTTAVSVLSAADPSDGAFTLNTKLTRGKFLYALWKHCGSPEPNATERPYTDVDESDYFYDAVYWAVEFGITSGITDSEFSPESSINRAQVATFLYRALAGNNPMEYSECPFTDVPEGDFYYKPACWVYQNGLMTAMDEGKSFDPYSDCYYGHIYWDGLVHIIPNIELGYVIRADYAEIACYTGEATEIVIPGSVDGFPVVKIGMKAFWLCKQLTGITIPDSVIVIGKGAFEQCEYLTKVSIGNGVASIEYGAFALCSSLDYIYFKGDAPEFGEEVFYSTDAVAYYPAGNLTWTTDVMQDYGGTITWVPYDLQGGEIPAPVVDTHDTIDELTELDYLAFSELIYENLPQGVTVKKYLDHKWNQKWHGFNFTYGDVYNKISNWKVLATSSNVNGFYAATFQTSSSEAVIAYRGSKPITTDNYMDIFDSETDIHKDWWVNDLQMQIFDNMGTQPATAIDYCKTVVKHLGKDNVVVTGHSLGGGLANLVSASLGCKAVSFNAISVLDAAYSGDVVTYADSFAGVDAWRMEDHANCYDFLAGMYEYYQAELGINVTTKPYVAHMSNLGSYNFDLTNIGNSISEIIYNHGIPSIVMQRGNGTISLTEKVPSLSYKPTGTITQKISRLTILDFLMPFNFSLDASYLDLGTTGSDFLSKGLSVFSPRVSYSGNGNDSIAGAIFTDVLIGGSGTDDLDGSYGNDVYIYFKGDGHDFIHDIAGDDSICLYGFSDNDVISLVDQESSNTINIACNGEIIISIYKKSREYSIGSFDSFYVYVEQSNGTEAINITDYFYTRKYGSRILVGCPVSIEVLDSMGNVVYTPTDGVAGSYYTDYGNFYVFEEENGEYGKVLDLFEGYTARIVGTDEGTMDVTYQVPVDGELTDPVSVSGVPVTEDLTATFEESEDGDVYLIVDEDSDGETDSEWRLLGECPFTDVPEDSFYYEPVVWAVKNGITNGATETTYNPNGTCLRAQVVTFLHRADGNPAPTSDENPFTDVKSSDFFYQPVLWAVEKGITNGTSATTFGSYANCNRAAVVTFLWRAAGSPEPESTNNPFVDVKTTDYFYKPVLWAVENGITNGVDATRFGPATDCNRAQVVTFLYRAYN